MSYDDPFASSTSIKFPEVGATARGRILSWEQTQQTDYQTGKPKTFDDGNPMMQLVITLDVDGEEQKLYAPRKGVNKPGTRTPWSVDEPAPLYIALKNAVQKSGSKMQPGGTLAVRYECDGEAASSAFNPPKLYKAKYEAPDAFGDDFDAAPAASTPTAADEDF